MKLSTTLALAGLLLGAAALAFGPDLIRDDTTAGAASPADEIGASDDRALPPRQAAESAPLVAGEFVLAASWQPAFCEGASNKPECRALDHNSIASARFSLHGLWPQPRDNEYCDVPARLIELDRSGRWRDLPDPALSSETAARLDRVMPGRASELDRHEWIKHGTCAGTTADAYYRASIALMDALNESGVAGLIRDRRGNRVNVEDLRAAADRSFGDGAGRRLLLDCNEDGRRRLVNEIRISLSGPIGNTPDLGVLMRSAPALPPGCPSGIVDLPGNQ